MNRPLLALLLAAASLPAGAAAQQPYPWGGAGVRPPMYDARAWGARPVEARVWVENERDYFRRGDRLQIRFSASHDAYVALVHIDPEGNLDFIHPATPWDDEYVRGGHVYTLPRGGAASGWPVRGSAGIGYLYLLASAEPLDFSYFRGGRGAPWDWSYAGRAVRGDPFFALHQLTRMLLPGWGYAPYAVDYFGYHVGGRHRYPRYACSDFGWDRGWGWTPMYGHCDRLDRFLLEDPYYYDPVRYRGDRWRYYRDYERLDPRHGYKEDPQRGARGFAPQRSRSGDVGRAEPPPVRDDEPERNVLPPARRPTLERRPSGREPSETPAARGRAPAPSGSGDAPARGVQRPRSRPSGGS